MDFSRYQRLFEDILHAQSPQAPYDNPAYLDYAKLNWSRMNRWLKKGILYGTVLDAVRRIATPQQWLVITEPACGGPPQSVPCIQLIAQQNPLLSNQHDGRDTQPCRINEY